MKIQLCDVDFDKEGRSFLNISDNSKFIARTTSERNFIKFIKLLEINSFFEKKIFGLRNRFKIPQKGLKKPKNMYESINYFEKKFDRKSRDKLMDELKKLVSEIGIKDSEESFSLLFFILYDIYFLPDLTGIIFSYEKPDDKKWPPIKSGQIDITITKRMNWSEFEKIVKRRWKTIESIMQQKRFPSFSYPKIGFHDVDLLIEIYKMRRRGLKYKEITDKLEAKSFPVPEETLRQKIRAVNKFFVKNN